MKRSDWLFNFILTIFLLAVAIFSPRATPVSAQSSVAGNAGQTAASFESLTVAGTAVGLQSTTITPITGRSVTYCAGVLETAAVRERHDSATAPTSSVGLPIAVGQFWELRGTANLKLLKFIRTTGSSGLLQITCYW